MTTSPQRPLTNRRTASAVEQPTWTTSREIAVRCLGGNVMLNVRKEEFWLYIERTVGQEMVNELRRQRDTIHDPVTTTAKRSLLKGRGR